MKAGCTPLIAVIVGMWRPGNSFLGYVNLESLNVPCYKPLPVFFLSRGACQYYLLWRKSLENSLCAYACVCGFPEAYEELECKIWNAVDMKIELRSANEAEL